MCVYMQSVITGGDRGVGGQTAVLNWCQDSSLI